MVVEKVIPQIHGGRKAKVVEIDGPAGPFDLAALTIDKDGIREFFYQDEHAHFRFLAELHTKPRTQWIIIGASSGGPSFTTTAELEGIFRANIEYFLKNRRSTDPAKHGDASTAAVPVTFSWRIVR
jgi:hypothetical protein